MSDDKQPLIQDEDRSTQGGPQRGTAFMMIVGIAIAAAVIAILAYVVIQAM